MLSHFAKFNHTNNTIQITRWKVVLHRCIFHSFIFLFFIFIVSSFLTHSWAGIRTTVGLRQLLLCTSSISDTQIWEDTCTHSAFQQGCTRIVTRAHTFTCRHLLHLPQVNVVINSRSRTCACGTYAHTQSLTRAMTKTILRCSLSTTQIPSCSISSQIDS